MNKVLLTGRLGKDPIIRPTRGGKGEYARFSIATHKVRNEVKYTTWIRVLAFGNLVKAARHLKKGRLVLIEGELDNDPKNHLYVKPERIEYLDSPEKTS